MNTEREQPYLSASIAFMSNHRAYLILALLTFIGSPACLEEGNLSFSQTQSEYRQRTEYPEGPYGTAVGSALTSLSFKDRDGEQYTLESIHQDDFNQLLLITTSAEWCTACIKEQPKLEGLYEEYHSRGLEVLVTLFQDSEFEPATPELSAAWQDKYELSFPVVSDSATPSTFSEYYDVNLTPMVMLVKVNTMEIIYLTQGFDEDQVTALIEANLPETLPKSRAYPVDSIGVEEGAVIKPLDFLAADGAQFNTQQIYNDLSKTLLLFTTSAEWCTACIKEQPKLQALYESYGDQGLEVLVTLFQDSDFEPATPELATRWREKYDLSYLVVADPQEPSVMSEYYDVNLTPMVMLVDTITMEIMYLTQGFDEDQVRALIESKLGTSPSE